MNLSKEEKKFYEGVYQKLDANGQKLDETNCIKLMERGIEDQEIVKKVWNIVSDNHSKKILSKQEFFKVLKCIAAYQKGLKIEESAIKDFPELPKPNLPKRSTKATTPSESTLKRGDSTENPSASILSLQSNISDLNIKKSVEKENTATNNMMVSTPLPQSNQESIKKPINTHDLEESKSNKVKESEKKLEPEKKPEPVRNIKVSMDSELPLPGTIERVEMPAFDESVNLTNAAKLVNPFKMTQDLGNSSVNMDRTTDMSTNMYQTANMGNVKEDKFKDYYANAVDIDTGNQYDNERKHLEKHEEIKDIPSYKGYLESKEEIMIEIVEYRTHSGGLLNYNSYTSYIIRSTFPDGNVYESEKRYSDFSWLDSYLRSQSKYKGLVFPMLPEKKMATTDTAFVNQRKIELIRYLKNISRHNIMNNDEVFRIFLGDEKATSFDAINQQKGSSGTLMEYLDLQKVKKTYEYAWASAKVKLRKEEMPFDAQEKMEDILKLDDSLNKFLETLQRKRESYQMMHNISANLNIIHTKIMNKAEDSDYYAIGNLSSLFAAEIGKSFHENSIIENLIQDINLFKNKLDSFKSSYALLISTLQETLTNREVLKQKESKLLESQALNDQENMRICQKEVKEVENKIKTLQDDSATIRDNIISEVNNLFDEFEIFMPDAINTLYQQQGQQFEKACTLFNNDRME